MRPLINFLRRVKHYTCGSTDDGHHSVFEFMGAQWLIEGSRAFTHEIIRHRVASYWQESQRYVDYSKQNLRYCVPANFKADELFNSLSSAYLNMRASEVSPENARYLLPNASCSRLWVQMNAREFFINFLPLRTGNGAFHEIRLIAWLMFDLIIKQFPITSEWVWQNLPKLHPDYCRGIKDNTDCRIKSIDDAFKIWGMKIPNNLSILMNTKL